MQPVKDQGARATINPVKHPRINRRPPLSRFRTCTGKVLAPIVVMGHPPKYPEYFPCWRVALMSTSLRSGRLARSPLSTINKNSLLRSLSWTLPSKEHQKYKYRYQKGEGRGGRPPVKGKRKTHVAGVATRQGLRGCMSKLVLRRYNGRASQCKRRRKANERARVCGVQ